MSAKWRRTQKWDREHLRGPLLTPVRWVLGALSSIWLAVVLLTLVALYGVLASVPIGMLAEVPSWALIVLSVVTCAGLAALVSGWAARRAMPRSRRGWRFASGVLAGLAGGAAASWAWGVWAWPVLHYDPATGEGLRLFASFTERYEATTLRRLPGIEMTELEFYSAWPLRVILLLFVVNMVTATVRRIEFTFKNLGVLTVHGGIVVIALSSVYYQGFKQEGDTILVAGSLQDDGLPGPGPAQPVFYDATRVVLWASQEGRRNAWGSPLWEQRRVTGLPRYNAYNLEAGVPSRDDALLSGVIARAAGREVPESDDGDRSLSLRPATPRGDQVGVDRDIAFRIVGYAPYADLHEDTRLYTAEEAAGLPLSTELTPVREVALFFTPEGAARSDRPEFRFHLMPDDPVRRVSENSTLSFEMTRGMPASRWRDLTSELPAGAGHGLVVELPGETLGRESGIRMVIPAAAGELYEIGDTGWTVAVKEFAAEPPFPIITEGYRGATSSVAVVRITPPDGQAYDRWVYSRYPEISQDILDGAQADGRPNRRDADPSIRVGYIDATRGLSVHIDELTRASQAPRWRAAVRQPDGRVRVIEDVEPGGRLEDIIPRIDIEVREGWAHGETVERPILVPESERERRFVGTHDRAAVAVEVSLPDASGEGVRWSETVWVPFSRYMGLGTDAHRWVELPDGRRVELAFGRLQRRFPGFALQLVDFEMVAYDHRGAPRDYQSLIRVVRSRVSDPANFEPYERVAKLNAPLRAPYVWDASRPAVANAALRVTSGLNPNQYKISQAGWDQGGWQETQALADAGVIPEPYAQFTIMQVGNNPGIHLIALGGVMMGLGIPWAFYVKPWLVRREKARLAASASDRRGASVRGAAAVGVS